MMDPDHLHLLINEEIYLISEKEEIVEVPSEPVPTVSKPAEAPPKEELTVAEPASQKVLPLAVFHESVDDAELDLLKKIIDACKLGPGSYEVFANGFNKEVQFEKALVFVATAKKYYEAVPYQGSQILCAKPLAEIVANQQEKVKLWEALKSYL